MSKEPPRCPQIHMWQLSIIKLATSSLVSLWPLHFKISHWSARAETIQVHSTLEGEGLRAQEIIMDGRSTRIPTWQTMSESRVLYTWHILWMRVKTPHNYIITALGSCVRWAPSHCLLQRIGWHFPSKLVLSVQSTTPRTTLCEWTWPKGEEALHLRLLH